MRVSMFEQFNMMKFNLGRVQSEQVKLQIKNATGMDYQKLSEEPIKANQALIVRNSLNQVEQYQKNVNDARSFLESVESTLGTAVDILQQTREQALKAANGTLNDKDKETLASVIDQNIEQVVALANTKFLGKQLFAGEKTQTIPFVFDGSAVTYNGDSNVPKIKVSPNYEVEVANDGETVFKSIFEEMIKLRDEIKQGNNNDVETMLSSFDSAMNNFVDYRSDIGVRMQSMDMYKKNYELESTNLKTKKGEVEDADLTETIMEYAHTQQVHQGIIAVTNKMFDISLLKYM